MAPLPTQREFRDRRSQIHELATLPHVMARMPEISTEPAAGARELGQAIAEDQSVSAKVLKVANSAFYGRPGSVPDIVEAVVLLGFDEVKRLTLSVSVLGLFGGSMDDYLPFWLHSFHTGAVADVVDRHRGRGNSGAFTAGLLHDLGHIVLHQYFPDIHRAVQSQAAATGQDPLTAEEFLLGFTHAHIGFWLSERRRFPPALSESVRVPHQPGTSLGLGRLTRWCTSPMHWPMRRMPKTTRPTTSSMRR